MVYHDDTALDSLLVSTDLSAAESFPMTIIRAIAALENEEPTDLPPLADAVDPDALPALTEADTAHLEIAFTYCDYEVVVTPDHLRVH